MADDVIARKATRDRPPVATHKAITGERFAAWPALRDAYAVKAILPRVSDESGVTPCPTF